jgi:hypothetical protein
VATLSLVPQQVDLALYAGDGAALRITVRNTESPPAPLDLTGAVTAQIRHARPDAAPLVDFTVDAAEAASGVVVLHLTGAQTAALVNGTGEAFKGVYDVQWTPEGSEPVTLVQGAVTCTLDVTRAP